MIDISYSKKYHLKISQSRKNKMMKRRKNNYGTSVLLSSKSVLNSGKFNSNWKLTKTQLKRLCSKYL